MGFPPSVIPGLFKRTPKKDQEFDMSDVPKRIPEHEEKGFDDGHLLDALARWRQASQPLVRELIIQGLEVAAREILRSEDVDGNMKMAKFNSLIAARDVLWETMKHTGDTKRDRTSTYKR